MGCRFCPKQVTLSLDVYYPNCLEFPECFTDSSFNWWFANNLVGWFARLNFTVSKTFRANGYGRDNTEIDVANLELESSSVLGEAEQNEDMLSFTRNLHALLLLLLF